MQEKKVKDILCPYCCHRFHPNEAHFRLNAPCTDEPPSPSAKKGKKKSAKDEGLGKVLDEKLYRYNMDVLKNDSSEAEKNSMQFLAVSLETEGVSPSEFDIEKYGFTQKVTYTIYNENSQSHESPKTFTTQKRLCPNCHNQLPIGYGLRETILISIIGDARAGKSIYLTMLINELESNPDFVSKLNFIGDQHAKDSIFESYQKPLLHNHVLVDSTKRKKIPPFSYNFWYQYRGEDGILKENTIDIIFYDIAGEDLRDDHAMRQNGFNIRDSSGLIFLIDPTSFKKMEDVFMLADRSLIDNKPTDNSTSSIFTAMYNYFLGLDTEKSDIPVAMAISKADLFRYVNMSFFDEKPESRIRKVLEGESYNGYVHMNSARGINTEVRELLSYLGEEQVLNNALGCFKNVGCFAVSSLGKKPVVETITNEKTGETTEKGYVDGELEPFRVKEPFYWLLMKNNLLYRFDNGVYYKNGETPVVEKGKAGFVEVLKKMFSSLFAFSFNKRKR